MIKLSAGGVPNVLQASYEVLTGYRNYAQHKDPAPGSVLADQGRHLWIAPLGWSLDQIEAVDSGDQVVSSDWKFWFQNEQGDYLPLRDLREILEETASRLEQRGFFNKDILFLLLLAIWEFLPDRDVWGLSEEANRIFREGLETASREIEGVEGGMALLDLWLQDKIRNGAPDSGLRNPIPGWDRGAVALFRKSFDLTPAFDGLTRSALQAYREQVQSEDPSLVLRIFHEGMEQGREYPPAGTVFQNYISALQGAPPQSIQNEFIWLAETTRAQVDSGEGPLQRREFYWKLMQGKDNLSAGYIKRSSDNGLPFELDAWGPALDFWERVRKGAQLQGILQEIWKHGYARDSLKHDPDAGARFQSVYSETLVHEIEGSGEPLAEMFQDILRREKGEGRSEGELDLAGPFRRWVQLQLAEGFYDSHPRGKYRRITAMESLEEAVPSEFEVSAQVHAAFDAAAELSQKEETPHSAVTHGSPSPQGIAFPRQPESEFLEHLDQPPTRPAPWAFYEPLQAPLLDDETWDLAAQGMEDYLMSKDPPHTLVQVAKEYTPQQLIAAISDIARRVQGSGITPWGVAYAVAQVMQVMRSRNSNILQTIRQALVEMGGDLERIPGEPVDVESLVKRSMPRIFFGIPADRIKEGERVRVDPGHYERWYRRRFDGVPRPVDEEGNLLPIYDPEGGDNSLLEIVNRSSNFGSERSRIDANMDIYHLFSEQVKRGAIRVSYSVENYEVSVRIVYRGERREFSYPVPLGDRANRDADVPLREVGLYEEGGYEREALGVAWTIFCQDRNYSAVLYSANEAQDRLQDYGIYIQSPLPRTPGLPNVSVQEQVNRFFVGEGIPHPPPPTLGVGPDSDLTDRFLDWLAREYPGERGAVTRRVLFQEGGGYINSRRQPYWVDLGHQVASVSESNISNLGEVDTVMEPVLLGKIPDHVRRVQAEMWEQVVREMPHEPARRGEEYDWFFTSVRDIASWLWYGANSHFPSPTEALHLAQGLYRRSLEMSDPVDAGQLFRKE